MIDWITHYVFYIEYKWCVPYLKLSGVMPSIPGFHLYIEDCNVLTPST